ncbi:MAG TPA: phosphoribosylformylglycinamidine cyclo-ligase [Deltaproteobacteria bacterium]|nr:phosphoribosylformylglycinamidine cyclo-ligase [Deltaproteobacteria bacterium]OQC28806.1 MAG: Phosphoribosylformylglycinamidine cyclo-ligase [Deltaproteobacteria bacterium ADurb.Bin072]HRW80996.1 phosphoribosylformylglycinamidine cyclo-ligase [Desulfomonilia bacterium]NMD39730.1 phosphoribosylformylglycinamidine cyclo-ligase [Deltaproteobacteria bacterium]HNQ86065.1 phosphoribosylformylglycinamidine cyclo-ligase [Deltaproteobacteria bacterium]
MSLTYRDAGVDIDKQNLFVKAIKSSVKSTHGPEVIGGIGGFAGMFKLDIGNYTEPVLVSSTDGVGTKLKIAFMAENHEGIGIDLVAMVVNDLVVVGAQPLFFLDYFATGRLSLERAKTVIAGITRGCKEAGCALIGGETAEMPGFYREDEYDLAGFGVGVVDSDKIIDGSRVSAKDVIIGIHSSGLHSNGFSLVRKVLFERAKLRVDDYVEDLGRTLAEELLTPTRIYVKSALNVLRGFEIKGVVHITGGGFIDNIPRVLPSRSSAHISRDAWEVPPVFRFIRDIGKIDDAEMYRTFNMGIGMILIVSPKDADEVMLRLRGLKESAEIIGHIESRTKGAESVVIS